MTGMRPWLKTCEGNDWNSFGSGTPGGVKTTRGKQRNHTAVRQMLRNPRLEG